MKYKRKDDEADKENPVALPSQETIVLSKQDSEIFVQKTFQEAAKEVMKTHKDTFEKLRDSDFTQTSYGMFKSTETGFWNLVEIKYDPLNLTVSPKIILTKLDDPNSGYAQERLQVLMGNTLFS